MDSVEGVLGFERQYEWRTTSSETPSQVDSKKKRGQSPLHAQQEKWDMQQTADEMQRGQGSVSFAPSPASLTDSDPLTTEAVHRVPEAKEAFMEWWMEGWKVGSADSKK